MPAILFPDIEAHVITRLRALLTARTEPFAADVWVSNQMPQGPNGEPAARDRMVLVRDDGGPSLGDVRAVARLGVNVWGESEEVVSDLANLVSALVAGLADGSPIVRATSARPYSVEDDAHRPRMYFTAELTVRGASL